MTTRIRLAHPNDAPGVAAIYAPIVRDTHLSAEFATPTVADMRSRIVDTLATHPWLVAERDGEIVGFAYGTRFRTRPAYQWTAEVSVYIHAHCHRLGLGWALYTSLLECLRIQGFVHAIAVIALPNPPSVALHESLGFVQVGVFPSVCFKSVANPPFGPRTERIEATDHQERCSVGRWYDIGWWRRLLGYQSVAPPRLRTPGELFGTPRWETAIAAGIESID